MVIVRRVVGKSMLPTLLDGDIVFGRTRKKAKAGDIVIAVHKNREIIKRVSKITGEQCFIEGDNKQASTDSRHFGPIAVTDVKAVVIWAFTWPRHSRRG